MGNNLRTLLMRHLSVMKQHPTLDIDAVVANPNLTLYEFDTLITSKSAGFVSGSRIVLVQSMPRPSQLADKPASSCL
jgi:hypothetical protein